MFFYLSLSHLYFKYERAVEPLFNDISVQFPRGWTGVVGANGTGKTTLLNLLVGNLVPESGYVQKSGAAVLCEQTIFNPPDCLADLFDSYDRFAFRLQKKLLLTPDMPERWHTLSFGERKKLQIALALLMSPDIMCIDEPTNHLDVKGRALLINELANYRGIGVIVSHDRELLDKLCKQCLFLEHGKAFMRSGGYSSGCQTAQIELENNLEKRKQLARELKRHKQELQRRRKKEQLSRGKNSKRKLSKHDHDRKERVNVARLSGRDCKQSDAAGRQAKIVAKANAKLAAFSSIKKQKITMKIPYGQYSAKNVLLNVKPQSLLISESKNLTIPELVINNHDRIAITGENGSGKSTLLRYLLGSLKLDQDEYLYMPQELDKSMRVGIFNILRKLPRNEFSKVMGVVASLGSRAEQLLTLENCSPGEWRKLFFGLGVLRQTSLIIMDEPTNHLDLPSIEQLENALGQCKCALLLVSHDKHLLEALCNIYWHIEAGVEVNTLIL